jgi:hypothetical protein
MTVRADGEVFPLTKEDLKTTELKRWPDFDFFIGGNEPGAFCQSPTPTDHVPVSMVCKSKLASARLSSHLPSHTWSSEAELCWKQMTACRRIYRSALRAS